MTDKINRAKLLANFIHYNQKRRDGQSYIKHCERVAEAVGYVHGFKLDDENIICAAFLHDCIEDADPKLNMNDFILTAFGYDIWDIVITLTHDTKLESYNEYIARVFQHPTAWQIKWADLRDNCSYKTTKQQLEKYRNACIMLQTHGIIVPDDIMKKLHL
jgi:(p)ppGpp synthase/HD superfamily hydrolase